MKIQIPDDFVSWFRKTNPHFFVKKRTRKEINKEIEDYVNDVIEEHMETMESDLIPSDDDAPDSGFIE
jgi:hypothetical protein